MYELIQGDCIEVMKRLDAGIAQTCVTSPPYYGVRDYGTAQWEGGDAECDHVADASKTKKFGNPEFNENRPSREATKGDGYYFKDLCGKCGARRIDNQIGLEATPEEYVSRLVDVFREVRRLLRDDGTLWLNLGDSYWGGKGKSGYELPHEAEARRGKGQTMQHGHSVPGYRDMRPTDGKHPVIKPKDLIGIPWRVAFALQADGWYLRSDIIWHKPNPMPESVTDRPTKAHEYIFLLSKSQSYFYDADAVREKQDEETRTRADFRGGDKYTGNNAFNNSANRKPLSTQDGEPRMGRNRRSVWTVTTKPFSGWTKTSRQVPLAEGVLSGGMTHKVSPDCQLHGYLCRQDSTPPYDVRAIGEMIHNARNGENHDQEPRADSVPTDPRREPLTQGQSSDLPGQSHLPFATDHSNQSHRTGHDPATNPAYTPSAQSSVRTERKSETPASSGQGRGNGGYSISAGESGDSQGNQIAGGTVDIPVERELYGASVVSLKDSGCTCVFYHTITEETSHFATFPPDLIEPCILAGSKPGDTVLDPFNGSGTTGAVALKHHRQYIGIDLNPDYLELAHSRITQAQPLLLEVL